MYFHKQQEKKEQILLPRLCVCCHIFLSGKHMDWKGVGSEACLPCMEGENICDVPEQQLFWKSNSKKPQKTPLTCMQTDFIDGIEL